MMFFCTAHRDKIRAIGDLNYSDGPKSCSTDNIAVKELLTFFLAILCHRENILGGVLQVSGLSGSLAADDTPLRISTDFQTWKD